MNRDTLMSLVRHFLTSVGAFLIGKNLIGITVDESIWQGVVGVVMTLVGFYLSIKDKTITEEKTTAVLRHILSVFGGFLVAKNRLSLETLNSITAMVILLVPLVWSEIMKRKNRAIAQGRITPKELKK